jgi:hypothetical protein
MYKVRALDMPAHVRCWLSSFLSNRTQCTKCNTRTSGNLPVNLGVVQGSALGPVLFSTMVSDLNTISNTNELIKFADDMTLLVPETSETSIDDEFESIKDWATRNKMIIHFDKTKELVFRRPRPAKPILPPTLSGIERVTVAKLLGVYLKDNLSFSHHVDFIINQCSQRMFLLRALRNRGMSTTVLEVIFTAVVVSRIIYAASSWGGFVNASEQRRIDNVFQRCHKFKYCASATTFEKLLQRADRVLFRKVQNTEHCLSHLLPDIRATASTLRERGHPYVLPSCNSNLFKRSFINRALFNFI